MDTAQNPPKLDLSPDAEDAWEHILSTDQTLAEVLEDTFDLIEADSTIGKMRTNHQRFITRRVPGRDDLYMIAWENRDHGPYVLYVGRAV